MMRLKLQIVFALLLSINCFAQSGTYTWEEGMEIYHAKFDPKKYTVEEINLIHDYLVNSPSGLATYGEIWHIDQINDTIIPIQLDSFFTATLEVYKTIKLPEGEFWSNLLNRRRTELNEWYQAKSTFVRSFQHPEVLLDENYPDCQDIARTLNGTESQVLQAWRILVDEQKKVNCCPDELEKKYAVELNSEWKKEYAVLEITMFDWWNCRNQYIHYVNDDNGIILEEFARLFTSLKVEHSID